MGGNDRDFGPGLRAARQFLPGEPEGVAPWGSDNSAAIL